MALIIGENSYIDADDADAYFADNLQNAAWTALSATVKDQALVTAGQRIELRVIDDYQFPIDEVDIPDNLAAGNAEYALAMTQDSTLITGGSEATGSNNKKLKAGSAEIEYFRFDNGTGTQFPNNVLQLIEDCLNSSISTGDLSFVSGTDVESSFSEAPLFPLNRGY